MNFLKGLAISILTLLLFLSLAVFGMLYTLENTFLNPDFLADQVDRLDVSALAKEVIEEQISEQLPPEMAFLEESLYRAIADNEPWLKEQVNGAIYSGYDYFLGKSERLSLMIDLAPLKESLRDNVWQMFQQNIPPALAAAPPAMLEQYFDQFYEQLAEQIPSEIEFDESSLPPDSRAVIGQIRESLSYVQTAHYALIGLMALLVAAIILLERNVKKATRGLGITFLIYGILEFAGVYAINNFLPTSLPLPDIPPSLQTWLLGLIADSAAPLQTFSIGLMAAGAVLIVVSIVYRRRSVEEGD